MWNHAPSANTTFTLYHSGSLKATMPTAPGAQSLLCLSCHDGSAAIDAYGAQATGANYISTTNRVGYGGDLTKDHPIGFDYTSTLGSAANHLNSPTTVVAAGLPLYANLGASSHTLECSTCHTVHDPTITPFLRMNNAGSALCRACHTY